MADTRFLWAKLDPYKSLRTHMAETALVAKILLTSSVFNYTSLNIRKFCNLTESEFISLVMYLAAVHDVGKIHPLFVILGMGDDEVKLILKQVNPALFSYGTRSGTYYSHELHGAEVVARAMKRHMGTSYSIRISKEIYASAVRWHHQREYGSLEPLFPGNPVHNVWISLQDSYEEAIWNTYKPPVLKKEDVKDVNALALILSALVTLSDWIASGSILENSENWTEQEKRKVIRRYIRQIGLEKNLEDREVSFLEMWPDLVSLRPLQALAVQLMEERIPCFVLIKDVMGGGKTACGTYIAEKMRRKYKKEGFYFALPTQASAFSIQEKIQAMLSATRDTSAVLVHSAMWITSTGTEKGTPPDAQRWLEATKRGFLCPYAVGTIDQALLACMKARHSNLRMMGLINKVLIIDEAHAYDAYMSGTLEHLLRWCRKLGIPVVIMSATLPAHKERSLIRAYTGDGLDFEPKDKYPCITEIFDDGTVETHTAQACAANRQIKVTQKRILHNYKAIAKEALKKAESGGCICVLMNTVAEAQEVYRNLQNMLKSPPGSVESSENGLHSTYGVSSGAEIMLFHARFPYGRRKQIENACLKKFGTKKENRPQACILVATQVAEQSLDLDFDYMMVAIAPIDLIFQRIGREHRHENTIRPDSLKTPEVMILVPAGDSYGSTEAVYFPLLLKRTQEELSKKSVLTLPGDIQDLTNKVYREEYLESDEYQDFVQKYQKTVMEKSLAQNAVLSDSEKNFCLNQAFECTDDEEAFSAMTRLGEPTVQTAFLTQAEYARVRNLKRWEDHVSAKIFDRAVSLNRSMLEKKAGIRFDEQNTPNIGRWGGGKCGHILILPMEDGTDYVQGPAGRIVNHEDLGIYTEK